MRDRTIRRCQTCHMQTSDTPSRPMPQADRCVRFGVFPECPLCGGELHPEHAHFKCGGCGWRDSCCD